MNKLQNMNAFYDQEIDGKATDFPLYGNEARFHERENLAALRTTAEMPVVPGIVTPELIVTESNTDAAIDVAADLLPEAKGPKHRADVPMKGILKLRVFGGKR